MKKTNAKCAKQLKYVIILALAFALVMAFAGCARAEETDLEADIIGDFPWGDLDDPDDPAATPDDVTDTPDRDIPNYVMDIDDIVVATANGVNIYKRDIEFEIFRAKGNLLWEYFYLFADEWDDETANDFMGGLMTGVVDSDLIDFDREFRDGKTFGQALLEEAVQLAAELKVYLAFAQEIGVELTETGLDEINFHIDNLIWDHGEEELTAMLIEDGIRGISHLAEIYVNHWTLDTLVFTLMSEPSAFVHFEAYMPEEDCDAYVRATAILERLHAGEDFTELLLLYGEDPGMGTFPDGYTFVEWQMVPEFSEGTMALEIGEISGLVKSNFGYHIILRVEPDPDNMMQAVDVPIEELLGAMHILIQTNELSEEDRMIAAITAGFETLTNDIDIAFLPALWDIDARW